MAASIMPGISREILHVHAILKWEVERETAYLTSFAHTRESIEASEKRLDRYIEALRKTECFIEEAYFRVTEAD